jgi:hypothetical protein
VLCLVACRQACPHREASPLLRHHRLILGWGPGTIKPVSPQWQRCGRVRRYISLLIDSKSGFRFNIHVTLYLSCTNCLVDDVIIIQTSEGISDRDEELPSLSELLVEPFGLSKENKAIRSKVNIDSKTESLTTSVSTEHVIIWQQRI